MQPSHMVRLFGLNNLSIEAELRRLESHFDTDIGRRRKSEAVIDDRYLPQFPEQTRREAEAMAQHYMIFYCLENTIRTFITERLEEEYGEDWWNSKAVPEVVHRNAESNKKKELMTGVTMRSPRMIDYTNFGELGEIIKANWSLFGETFRDIRAVERILGNLNTLRASIAHCSALAEDEVLRLHLALRDWFRQME